jgi:hypothetical protein
MVVLCVTRNWFNIRMIRPFKRVKCSGCMFVPYGNLTRDCSGNRLVSWFLGLSLGYAVKAFTVTDWISLAITEHAFIFLSDSYKTLTY